MAKQSMKIGFTGTQQGMTEHQKVMVELILAFCHYSSGIGEVHHGGCIGADLDFHTLASIYDLEKRVHPSDIKEKQAEIYLENRTTIMPEYPPLVRNKHVVDAVDIMIATPKERLEVPRSGTWATIRYCRKQGKLVYVIYP